MTNFQVYRKTLSFSFLEFLVDLLALIAVVGFPVLGFVLFNKSTDKALIGLLVGFLIGLIVALLISFFIGNRIKAAQISMMTIGVVDGQLPANTFHAGFEEVRGRFGKITVFFAITGAIKSVFRQLGRAINKLGTALGGDVGNGITSAIDSAIQTLIAYLCDCCLGWVLYNKETNSWKAGCEGAVIFFKHGKTLIRNIGRIFGMGFLSFLLIGGGFFGISYLIFMNFPQVFQALSTEITEAAARGSVELPEIFSNVTFLTVICCAIFGVIMWGILHSVLIRPFILVGVLRNFMAAGLKEKPTEADFAELEKKAPKFARLRAKAE